MASLPAVTIVGLGNMGMPLARNFIESGVRVRLFNRTPAKLAAFPESDTVKHISSLADVSSFVLTLTSNDAALEAVVFGDAAAGTPGFGETLGAGGIHLCCATISPDLSAKLAEYHAARGCAYVAGPVFGRPEAVAGRRLLSVLGGPAAARAVAAELMALTAWKVVHVGESQRAAHVMKLAGNFQIMAMMEMVAESLALAEKAGVPRDAAYDLYYNGLFSSPVILQGYARMIAAHRYTPVGFSAENGLKDATLVAQTAAALGVPMPVADIVKGRMARLVAEQAEAASAGSGTGTSGGGEDWAAMAKCVSVDAGLPTETLPVPAPPAAAAAAPSAAAAGGAAAAAGKS